MSLYFRSLPWVIPQMLMAARPQSEVAIVSPWVNDVEFDAPALVHLAQRPTLSWVLDHLHLRGTRLLLVVRESDHRVKRLLGRTGKATRTAIRLIEVPHIHTKAVVTERLALTTSANLLDTSLYRNRETVYLAENPYGSARRWLLFEQEIHS